MKRRKFIGGMASSVGVALAGCIESDNDDINISLSQNLSIQSMNLYELAITDGEIRNQIYNDRNKNYLELTLETNDINFNLISFELVLDSEIYEFDDFDPKDTVNEESIVFPIPIDEYESVKINCIYMTDEYIININNDIIQKMSNKINFNIQSFGISEKTLNISVKNNNDFDSKFRGIARKVSEAKDDIIEFEIPQNESILKEYEVESTSDIISSNVEDDMRVFEY